MDGDGVPGFGREVVDPAVGLGLVLAVLVGYGFVLAAHGSTLRRLPLPRRWVAWLGSAIDEEELELVVAIRPKRGNPRDAIAAALALVVVVVAAVSMERGASTLGHHYAVARRRCRWACPGGGDQLAERRGGGLPRCQGKRRSSVEHGSEQQYVERGSWSAPPGDVHRTCRAVRANDAHRWCIPWTHGPDAWTRLRSARASALGGLDHHGPLCRLCWCTPGSLVKDRR